MAARKKTPNELTAEYIDHVVRFQLADALMAAADGILAGRRGFIEATGSAKRTTPRSPGSKRRPSKRRLRA